MPYRQVRTLRSTDRWAGGLPTLFDGAWRCPVSGQPLSVVLSGTNGSAVLAGAKSNLCWPVVDNIPFLRADRPESCERIVDAVASGRSDEARRLLFMEPRDPGQLPHQLGDESTAKARLREISRVVKCLESKTTDDREATFREAVAAFGYEIDDLARYRHSLSTAEGLAMLGLVTVCGSGGGLVFHLGCGLGEAAEHLASHGLQVIGTDTDWTSLWLSRHLLGTTFPSAAVAPGSLELPAEIRSVQPFTAIVGSSMMTDDADQPSRLRTLASYVLEPMSRIPVGSPPLRFVAENTYPPDAVDSADPASRATKPTEAKSGCLLFPGVHGEWSACRTDLVQAIRSDLPRGHRLHSHCSRRSDFCHDVLEFRIPDGESDQPAGGECFAWSLRTVDRPGSPRWELMLPVEGSPLTVSPLFERWCDGRPSEAADLLDWSDEDREIVAVLMQEGHLDRDWSPADTEIVELLRRRVLVAAH